MTDALELQDVPRIPLGFFDEVADSGGKSGPRPVVFVHGFLGNPGQFDTMKARYAAAGYDRTQLRHWGWESSYDPFSEAGKRTLSALGKGLAWAINDAYGTGTQVDIVAHSMGSLLARFAVKYGDADDHIAPLHSQVVHCVSLAGPNHGAKNEWLRLFGETGFVGHQLFDVTPGSEFLKFINQSPEVSSGTKWLTYRTPGDEEVDEDSVPLNGADNRRTDLRSNAPQGGSDPVHNSFLTDAPVTKDVIAFLSQEARTSADLGT
ncbi:alpha/beta fold hydrolase [Streptomyces sp. FXJ1.4098]|nr:alpha/beta fold hydrolase [Streptomyces sp. FXJ1.4098]